MHFPGTCGRLRDSVLEVAKRNQSAVFPCGTVQSSWRGGVILLRRLIFRVLNRRYRCFSLGFRTWWLATPLGCIARERAAGGTGACWRVPSRIKVQYLRAAPYGAVGGTLFCAEDLSSGFLTVASWYRCFSLGSRNHLDALPGCMWPVARERVGVCEADAKCSIPIRQSEGRYFLQNLYLQGS